MIRYMIPALVSAFIAGSGAACAAKEGPGQLGVLPIGATPVDFSGFRSNDCEGQEPALSDCSAVGADGLHYGFFDGALSRVVADVAVTGSDVELPDGIAFGQDIDAAAAALQRSGLTFDRAVGAGGEVVQSTGFVVISAAGVEYSLELHSDTDGRPVRVVERTDF